MAKSLRSKIKRRYRKLKRGHLEHIVIQPRVDDLRANCEKAMAGIQYRQKQRPNGFLHPDNPDALFAQFKPAPMIDLRSNAISGSGTEFSGGNRKKIKEPEHLDELREKKRRMKLVVQSDESDHEKIGEENVMETENTGTVQKQRKRTSKIRKTFVF